MVPVPCAHCKRVVSMFDTTDLDGADYCDSCIPERVRRTIYQMRFDRQKEELESREKPAPFSAPENGSQDRYEMRRRKHPWATHTLWWVLHNAVAHPLISIPWGPFFRFHDWTSERMHGVRR